MAEPSQSYDVTLKDLFKEQAEEILPHLVPGIEVIEERNIEAIRPTLRADLLYTVLYRGKPHLLHIEFESQADADMAYRLLRYHALFLAEYHLPTISVIVYPFEVSMVQSPLEEKSGSETLLTFHYRVLPLFQLDAEQYVREHILSMYPLLPTMRGANASLLLKAVDELAEKYEGKRLARRLLWFGTLLRRAKIVSQPDKSRVEEKLSMWDDLLENDEYIKKIKERAAAEATAEAKAEAEAEAAQIAQTNMRELRKAIVKIVEGRFPTLTDLAQQKVIQIEKPDVLYYLITQTATAPDEKIARFLLSSPAA
ncbi:MAG: hypothetical protein M3Z24_16475 [Chloroflexota bacterium]|nr:hypothetical protein [Chloroflexota bacterium]